MRIDEILVGLASNETLTVEPHPHGLTIVPLGSKIDPVLLARALRETLASPKRATLTEEAPFLRITAHQDEVEIAVADDAPAKLRLLTETRPGCVPLILEAKDDGEERVEALLLRIALATGAGEPDALFAMLARVTDELEARASDDELDLAYVDAHRRASALAKAVRAIDDRMTASVVPDWIWIATGFGGVGVFLTVVALLYPDLRIYVVPALSIFAMLGFVAYALSSWRELRIRGGLQIERRELRTRREAARAEARVRIDALAKAGRSPEEVLMRHERIRLLPSVPAIMGTRELGLEIYESLTKRDRQTIVLIDRVPSNMDDHLIRGLKPRVTSPSE